MCSHSLEILSKIKHTELFSVSIYLNIESNIYLIYILSLLDFMRYLAEAEEIYIYMCVYIYIHTYVYIHAHHLLSPHFVPYMHAHTHTQRHTHQKF